MDGVTMLPVCVMPRGIRGTQEPDLGTYELAAEAVATGNYTLLRKAMLTDPMIFIDSMMPTLVF